MAHIAHAVEINPPDILSRFFRGRKPKLWSVGDASILSRRLLGIISARQVDSDLASKSSELLTQCAQEREFAFAGGWHSPMEKEAFRMLLAQGAKIVVCVPKALNRFAFSGDLESRVGQGQLLLLTHCSPRAKRISRAASIRRNELVIGLAAALLVLSAPEESASLDLAKSALSHGKPVFTPEHHLNSELLACGALPATFPNVSLALASD